MENNNFERKGYWADFMENNDKNNLYHTIGVTRINELRILSNYIYC